jgi:hypothetical protein
VRILADDIDRDGETDALVVRGYEHPEGVSSGTHAILLRPAPKDVSRDDDSEVRLGFEDLVDHRRPGVCDFDGDMAGHARRFTEFPRWLFDAGRSNARDAGTAR